MRLHAISGLDTLPPKSQSLDIRSLFLPLRRLILHHGGVLLISVEVTLRFTSISDVVGPSVGVWGRWHLLLGSGRFDKSMSNDSSNTMCFCCCNEGKQKSFVDITCTRCFSDFKGPQKPEKCSNSRCYFQKDQRIIGPFPNGWNFPETSNGLAKVNALFPLLAFETRLKHRGIIHPGK